MGEAPPALFAAATAAVLTVGTEADPALPLHEMKIALDTESLVF
jgi:phage tail sheath gpL-like